MKVILIVVPVLALLFLAGCRTVETASIPVTLKLKPLIKDGSTVTLKMHKGAGQFEDLKPESAEGYVVNVPRMDGGYKQFLFIRYNVHDPKTYKIIQVWNNQQMLGEYSLEDLEKQPKNQAGFTVLSY